MTRSLFAYAVNTKANILAGSYQEGALGYATDTNEFGHYDGAAWVWGVNGGDHTALTNIGTNTHAQIDTALTRLANTSGTNTGDATVSDTASVDLTITGQLLSANVLPAGVDHNSLLNYAANRHFLQTDIDHLSSGLSTGLTKVTNGTGALSVVPDNSANWNTAFGWGNHASAGYVAGNGAITGATKTKITYDTKGLVTAGADATTADIADSLNKRYVTDAQLTVIGNTSGTNTGDVSLASPNHGLSLSSQVLSLGTPGTLTVSSTNAVSAASHTHAIASSNNPGATESLLSSAPSTGYLQLTRLGITTSPSAALHLGGTGGTASEGIEFGTDAYLHRVSAGVLRSYTSQLQVYPISANTTGIFRVIPSGSPASTRSTIQLFNTDFISDGTNYETGQLRFSSNNFFDINSSNVGTGTLRPIQFSMNSSQIGIWNTNGGLQILGIADRIQFILKNNATQVSNPFELQPSGSSTPLAYISPTGRAVFNAGLQLPGTGGTTAEGITLGDTNLYRSAANTLKTDDDLYITGTATLIANPSNDNHAIARRYAQSKGMNLFVNGFVGMLSNYNLSGLTFDSSDQYAGNGMLTKVSLGNLLSDEFIPVDPNRYYKASMWVKTLVDAGSSFNKFYSGFAAYDADSLFINAFMVVKQGASVQTTLAAPLKAGDTTISLTASTNWYNGATAAARNLVLYPYYNAGGYKYDDYTYSRHTTQGSAAYASGGAWANGGISGTTITLVSAWPSGELFPQTHKTHATTEPTWPTGTGAYVYDNNIYWQEVGAPVGGETAWSAGATITVNSYRVPTVANGHRYQAVDVNVWPAGTAVQNTNNPGIYRYPFANNVTPGTAWTNYTGVIGGYDTTGAGTATLFPYGTAFIKLAFLFNYTGTSSNKQGISAIWFSEVTANNIEAASATQQGVVSLGDQVLGIGVKSVASLVVNDGASGTADARMESATEQNMFLLDANGNTNGTLHFGGVTNGIQIDKGGRLTFNGTATYWKDIQPYSVSTGNGPSAPALSQYGTTGHYMRKFSDNHGSDEAMTIAFQLPHEWKIGSDVHFHIHVIPSANGSGGNNQVVFRASYQWVNIDGSFSTTTNTDLDTTFTVGATDGDDHKLWEPSALSGSGKTLSGGLLITLSRLSKTNPGGADNYTGDVWLLFTDCHCECDAVGSADETVK